MKVFNNNKYTYINKYRFIKNKLVFLIHIYIVTKVFSF